MKISLNFGAGSQLEVNTIMAFSVAVKLCPAVSYCVFSYIVLLFACLNCLCFVGAGFNLFLLGKVLSVPRFCCMCWVSFHSLPISQPTSFFPGEVYHIRLELYDMNCLEYDGKDKSLLILFYWVRSCIYEMRLLFLFAFQYFCVFVVCVCGTAVCLCFFGHVWFGLVWFGVWTKIVVEFL